MYQESFELVYNSTGSGANFAAFRVKAQSGGWHRVGDYGVRCHGAVPSASGSRGALIRAPGDTLRPPTDYEKVWDGSSSGERQHGSFWRPVPPAGYTCLGHVVGNTTNYNKPSTDIIRCINNAYVVEATTAHVWGYFDSRNGGNDGDVWMVIPKSNSNGAHIDTVYTQNVFRKPADSLVHTLNLECVDQKEFPTQHLKIHQF